MTDSPGMHDRWQRLHILQNNVYGCRYFQQQTGIALVPKHHVGLREKLHHEPTCLDHIFYSAFYRELQTDCLGNLLVKYEGLR